MLFVIMIMIIIMTLIITMTIKFNDYAGIMLTNEY